MVMVVFHNVLSSDFFPIIQRGSTTLMKINIDCVNTYTFFERGAGQVSVSFNFWQADDLRLLSNWLLQIFQGQKT